MIVHIVGAS